MLRAPHLLPRGNSLWSPCSRDHFKVLGLCLVREGLGRRAWLGGRAGGGPRQWGARDHVSSGTTGRWAEIPRRCAPSAAVSESGFFSSFPFSSFSFTRVSRGSQQSSPKLFGHPLFLGTHPKICAMGRISDYVRLGGGKGREEGCDLYIKASCLRGEGEVTDRYDLGVFACLQKL